MNLRQDQPGRVAQSRAEQLVAADHERGLVCGAHRKGILERGRDARARSMKARASRYHDIGTVRQRLADRLPRLAAHDDRMAEGHLLEVFHVFRQVPRKLAAGADHPVFGHCRHEIDGTLGFLFLHGGASCGDYYRDPMRADPSRYPRSFSALLLAGFLVVGLPLAAALLWSAWNTERLAERGTRSVGGALKASRASRGLVSHAGSIERLARQIAVRPEPDLLGDFELVHSNFAA